MVIELMEGSFLLSYNILQQRSQLSIQLTNVEVELENTVARLEEEQEAGTSARNQLAKLQAELQQMKSRFEKDLAARTDELEESRYN